MYFLVLLWPVSAVVFSCVHFSFETNRVSSLFPLENQNKTKKTVLE